MNTKEEIHCRLAELLGDFCNEPGHQGVKHPLELNMEYLREKIPHTKGEHPANKQGYFLCNGHCSWDKCGNEIYFCLECGYAECGGCAEDFFNDLEDLAPEWEGYGIANYCRGCGSHTSQVEIYHKLKWLKKQIYGEENQ